MSTTTRRNLVLLLAAVLVLVAMVKVVGSHPLIIKSALGDPSNPTSDNAWNQVADAINKLKDPLQWIAITVAPLIGLVGVVLLLFTGGAHRGSGTAMVTVALAVLILMPLVQPIVN
jgi:hypothetical protein